MRSIISAALLLALALPASAQTVVVRPPVRVVHVIPAQPAREVIVEEPRPVQIYVPRPVIQLGSPCVVALLGICVRL